MMTTWKTWQEVIATTGYSRVNSSLVDRPHFRPAQKRHRSRFISEPGPMPRNGPGSSVQGNGPGSCGATVPVVAINRDQCFDDQHVAHCEALVPVGAINWDE